MKRAGRVAGIGCAVMCVLLAAGMQVTWGQTTPAITVQPRPQIVQTGQTATFTVTATGEGTLSYQWRKDGQDLPNAGRITWPATGPSSTLTLNNVTAEDVGSYGVLVASSTSGTATSWPARLALAGRVYATGDNTSSQLGIGGLEPAAALIGNIVKVAAGPSHNLAVKSDGTVWAWGDGQLGDGTWTGRTSAIQVPGLSGMVAVAAGGDWDGSHSLAVKSDGTVWAWGFNRCGQLGEGTTTSQASPVQVLGLSGTVAVAAGNYHSLAIKSDGTVWAWGQNFYGQLGNGTRTSEFYDATSSPIQVPDLTGVVAVAAGGSHSLAIKGDGTVWAWGSNSYGQLGNGTWSDRTSPIQVPGLTGVAAVAAGYKYSLALKSDGTVWAWGENGHGQLGDGTTTWRNSPVQVAELTGVAAVAVGTSHSLAVKSDGTIWAWGQGKYGQLGNGTKTGYDSNPIPRQVPSLTGVVAAAAGLGHSLAVKSDGTVWAWGANYDGQLGTGTTTCQISAVQVPSPTDVVAVAAGTNHSLVVKSDGTIWAWGDNEYGQLGNGTCTPRTSPVQVPGLTGVAAVAASDYHSLTVKNDGTVWAWGHNQFGQLGTTPTTSLHSPIQVPSLSGVVAVAAAWGHSLALKSDGTVWAYGNNYYGQLGNGTKSALYDASPIPMQVPDLTEIAAVAAARYRSMALRSDGTVWTWGSGNPTPMQVPGLSGVVVVATSGSHTLAVKSDGTVWACGYNQYGQLGDGATTDQASPVQVLGLTGVVAVAAGAVHSLAVRSDGTVWAWGDNSCGQLGNGTTTRQTSPIQVPGLSGLAAAAGAGHSLFIAQGSTIPPRSTGTWPANNNLERKVQSIVVGFDRPVVNISPDDLVLSAGTVLRVQGSGQGPYAFAVTGLPSGTITATIGGDIAGTDGVLLPPYQWTFRVAWPSDINSDGYINVADLQLLVAAWGSQVGTLPSINWSPGADVNADGHVNVGDLQLLVANWGKAAD